MTPKQSAVGNQYEPAEDKPRTKERPPLNLLGRGFLSTLSDVRAWMIAPETKVKKGSGAEIPFSVEIADSKSSLARYLSISAKAKFGFEGADASARVSLVRNYKRSQRSLNIILNKTVATTNWYLLDPRWSSEAETLHSSDINSFVQRYGDQFIQSVTVGGYSIIIYTLDFNTEELASDFKASFRGSVGANSGAATVHERILQTASATSIKLQGISAGAISSPRLAMTKAGNESLTGKVDIGDPQVALLIEYFNGFEAAVRGDGVEIPVFIEHESSFEVNGAPTDNRIDLHRENALIDKAVALDDVIEERISQCEYMRDTAHAWNPLVTSAEIEDALAKFHELGRRLVSSVSEIANLRGGKLATEEADIPSLPATWVVRALKPAPGYPLSKTAFDEHGEARYSEVFPVPNCSHGEPFQIEVSSHFESRNFIFGTAALTIRAATQDNSNPIILGPFYYNPVIKDANGKTRILSIVGFLGVIIEATGKDPALSFRLSVLT